MNQTVSLPDNYTKKLKAEKKATGQTISEIVRRALDFYFERKERGNA
jgi:predicted DNA-binding protein